MKRQRAAGVIIFICRQNFGGLLAAMLVALTLLLAGSLNAAGRAEKKTGNAGSVLIFHGAWFDVHYPADFTAKPSLPSATGEGYDSAEFASPDGSVSFYVFAPQWGGNAADIDLNPERERLVAERSLQKADRKLRWFTIEARDGGYRRSYMETVAQMGSVKTIIGIKYRNEEARRRYLKEYLVFRQSLELYAD